MQPAEILITKLLYWSAEWNEKNNKAALLAIFVKYSYWWAESLDGADGSPQNLFILPSHFFFFPFSSPEVFEINHSEPTDLDMAGRAFIRSLLTDALRIGTRALTDNVYIIGFTSGHLRYYQFSKWMGHILFSVQLLSIIF